MNIILYVNSFLPKIGGKEIVVHYLAKELKKLGHDVRIVGPSGWIKHRKHHFDYKVHRWPTLRRLFKEKIEYLQLSLDTRFWNCDIIHAHTTLPNGYLAALLKRKKELPLVITPHGQDIHTIPEIGFGLRLDPVKRKKIEFAINEADVVTAISSSVKTSLLDAGCDDVKIRHIPNGIDFERFNSRKQISARKRFGFDENARLILSVGNYHRRKGQEIIIEAMPQVLSEFPQARLVIIGANQSILEKKAKGLGVEKSVCLTGSIPFPFQILRSRNGDTDHVEDLLAAFYSQSDVYVSAGINEEAEGLSLAVLDAMAAGLPVAATMISGNSEIVEDKMTGILVPPNNSKALASAIIAILGNRQKGEQMGKGGQRKVMRYQWKEIAKQYVDVYHEAIETTK